MGPRFRVSSERLEKPGIKPMTPGLEGEQTPGLEGEQLNNYATEASIRSLKQSAITLSQQCGSHV